MRHKYVAMCAVPALLHIAVDWLLIASNCSPSNYFEVPQSPCESSESGSLRRGVIAQPFRLWQLKPVSNLLHNAPNSAQV